MTLETVSCRGVLSSLKSGSGPLVGYLTNARKQLYTLDIVHIDPDSMLLEMKAPGGRVNPIDPGKAWALSFRDSQGAYQAEVVEFTRKNGRLRFILAEKLKFLARRQSIRLTVESRNPTLVRFLFRNAEAQGYLVDFNLRGMAVLVPEETAVAEGDLLEDGQFELRSYRVTFERARVLHAARTDLGWRLGLEFVGLSQAQRKTMKALFDEWFLSQKSSFPMAVDG